MNQVAKLDKRNVEDIIGLSPMQEGILFHYLLEPSSEQYFEQYSYRLIGALNFELFYKSWEHIIENNEILRAVYRWEKIEKPMQIILKQIPFCVNYVDLSMYYGEMLENELINIKNREKEIGFELRIGPLFRVDLCKLQEHKYEMIINNHHILYDGWSYGIILKEFLKTYDTLFQGGIPQFNKKIKFKEYLKWFKQKDQTEGRLFWNKYLTGYIPKKLLPIDHVRTSERIDTFNHSIVLIRELAEKVRLVANKLNVTQGTIFATAWGRLIQLYNNGGDVVFGITVSGRSSTNIKGIENLVGLIINTVPLRLKCSDDEKISSVIKKVGQDMSDRQEYEYIPLSYISNYSNDGERVDLFDSILVIENYPLEDFIPSEYALKIESYSGFGTTNYDLIFVVSGYNEIVFNFIYNSEVFDKLTIKLIAERYMCLIKAIVDKFECSIEEFKYMTDVEMEMMNNDIVEFDYL